MVRSQVAMLKRNLTDNSHERATASGSQVQLTTVKARLWDSFLCYTALLHCLAGHLSTCWIQEKPWPDMYTAVSAVAAAEATHKLEWRTQLRPCRFAAHGKPSDADRKDI